jgi:hypothetical protein
VHGGRKYVSECVQRPDEITELLALSISTRNKKSNFIKYGLRDAFTHFDRYQFGKYNRDGDVKLRDAIFITCPKPDTEAMQKIFNDIVDGTLEPPETWEVALSTKGASKETWEDLINRKKLGFMALLRNLNNCIKWEVNLPLVVSQLTDENAIKKSKQFPFRFYSAYRAIQDDRGYRIPGLYTSTEFKDPNYVSVLLSALNEAMEKSIVNVRIPGTTLVLIDVSGSMGGLLSNKSRVTKADISCVFGAIASKICENAYIVPFATGYQTMAFSEGLGILDRAEKLKNVNLDHSTDAWRPMSVFRQRGIKIDRVILFSDMQCFSTNGWDKSFAEEFTRYQKEVYPAYLYSIDLEGYGTIQVPQDNKRVCLMAGFSEKLLNYIPAFETDGPTLIKDIENYTPL